MEALINQIIDMAQNNVPVAIGVGVVLLYLLYRKPKLVLGVMALGAISLTVYFLIADAGTASSKQKQKMFRTY